MKMVTASGSDVDFAKDVVPGSELPWWLPDINHRITPEVSVPHLVYSSISNVGENTRKELTDNYACAAPTRLGNVCRNSSHGCFQAYLRNNTFLFTTHPPVSNTFHVLIHNSVNGPGIFDHGPAQARVPSCHLISKGFPATTKFSLASALRVVPRSST